MVIVDARWCPMNKYYIEFIQEQTEEFITEIHGTQKDITTFKSRVMKTCTLEELEQLDNKFINVTEWHNPEGI